jgi:thiol:disulfide interchange protein
MIRLSTAAACVAAVLALALASCSARSPQLVKFDPYSKPAFDAAIAKHQPVVVFATADWCGYCEQLHHGALADPTVKTALDAFARLEIDHSGRGALTASYLEENSISGLPTLIFFHPEKGEVARFSGNQPASEILAAAKKAAGG